MDFGGLAEVINATGRLIENNAGIAFVLFLFALTVLMNYAALVALVNMKTMERRKQLSMERVEEVADDMELFIQKKYLTLAKKILGDNYFDELETRLATYNINEAISLIKDEYRRRVRRNGFENKSPAQWITYVEACTQEDIVKFTRTVNASYHPASIIKRPDWFDWNQKEVVPEVKHRTKHLFTDLLGIAEKHKMRKFFFWRIML